MSIRRTLMATGVTALGIAAGLAHMSGGRRHGTGGADDRQLCTTHHLPIGAHPQSVCRWRA